MLRRIKRNEGGLPTTDSAAVHTFPDGSGRSVKMDSPLVKSMRKASGFVRFTYGWLFVTLIMILSGWRWIWKNNASVFLDCSATGCELIISPPLFFAGRNNDDFISNKEKSQTKKLRLKFERDQLVRADNIKWDPKSGSVAANYGVNSPTNPAAASGGDGGNDAEGGYGEGMDKYPRNKLWKDKKKKKNYRKAKAGYRKGGPDEDGFYDSYVMIVRDPLPSDGAAERGSGEGKDGDGGEEESASKMMQRHMAARHLAMKDDPDSLASKLAPFALVGMPSNGSEGSGNAAMEYVLHLRDFNVGQTRRLPRAAVAKINAYAKGRRNKLTLRENRAVAWQGLLLLILGIFSLFLCLLVGEFRDEPDGPEGSYRKRMAELRRRKKPKTIRNFGTKPLVRAAKGAGANDRSRASVRAAQRAASSAGRDGGTGYGSAKRG